MINNVIRGLYCCKCGFTRLDKYDPVAQCYKCNTGIIFPATTDGLFESIEDPSIIEAMSNANSSCIKVKDRKKYDNYIKAKRKNILDISAKYRLEIAKISKNIYQLKDELSKYYSDELHEKYNSKLQSVQQQIHGQRLKLNKIEYNISSARRKGYILSWELYKDADDAKQYLNDLYRKKNAIIINYKNAIGNKITSNINMTVLRKLIAIENKYINCIRSDHRKFSRYIEAIWHVDSMNDIGYYAILLKEASNISDKEDTYLKSICPEYEGRDIYVGRATILKSKLDKESEEYTDLPIDNCREHNPRYKWPIYEISTESDAVDINELYNNYLEIVSRYGSLVTMPM